MYSITLLITWALSELDKIDENKVHLKALKCKYRDYFQFSISMKIILRTHLILMKRSAVQLLMRRQFVSMTVSEMSWESQPWIFTKLGTRLKVSRWTRFGEGRFLTNITYCKRLHFHVIYLTKLCIYRKCSLMHRKTENDGNVA